MKNEISKIITFGLTFWSCVTFPANSLTVIQNTTQSAFIEGNKNQVNQEVSQIITNSFFWDYDFLKQSWSNFTQDDGFSVEETQITFIKEQNSWQDTVIDGNFNQVTQQIKQIQINLFSIDLYFSEPLALNTNSLINPFLDQISDLAWSDFFLLGEQFSFQEALILGEANQVKQTVYQTMIDIFLFSEDFPITQLETVLDQRFVPVYQSSEQQILWRGEKNQIRQEIYQEWLALFLVETDFQSNYLDLDKFIDPIINESIQLLNLETTIEIYRENSQNLTTNELSQSIPEPTSIISFLFLGILGICHKIKCFDQ